MDDSKKKISSGHGKKLLNPFAVKKPKKRSRVECELETNMTARVTSPASVGDGVSTSRYGRARRIKTEHGTSSNSLETLKSPKSENTPIKVQSPITKLVNSPFKTETPKKALASSIDNIDNIFQENKSLSRFSNHEVQSKTPSAKKFQKVYTRKDLIQNRDDDDDIIMIKDLFSPKSGRKQKKPVSSSKKQNLIKQNGHHIDNVSVVKTLDFDNKKALDTNKRNLGSNKRDSEGNKRDSEGIKKDSESIKRDSEGIKRDSESNKRKKEIKVERTASKNDGLEGLCPYQVGDLAWARMGTFPFWPCIITRDPASEMFVRKKLFGRVEHDILHVTFFADNGRRSWVVDNMLRHYKGLEEFISTKEKFTPEDKKKDPRLYAAFFISEKKQSLWNASVEEAEMISRGPKEQRVDIFHEFLHKARATKKQLKSGKVTRTDSDVSLSESLYDSLFSEDDSKTDDSIRSRNKSKNKSLDVSDVVTACLDNMAAKTGNIKIQRQSHMDRWLQKAKSKTPEKVKTIIEQILPKTPLLIPKVENVTPIDNVVTSKADKMVTPKIQVVAKVEQPVSNNKKKKLPHKEVKITKVYSLRRLYESQNAFVNGDSEIDSLKNNVKTVLDESKRVDLVSVVMDSADSIEIIPKVESISDISKEKMTNNSSEENLDGKHEDDNSVDDVLNALNELLEDTSTTDSNDVSKNRESIKTTEKEIKSETQVIQVDELEPMDVDECQEVEDHVAHKSTDNHVVIDSPIKIEMDLAESEDKIIICSPVKIENDSSLPEANLDLVANEKTDPQINDISNRVHQTSPLKQNEMVLIPEDCNISDDDSNSITTDYGCETIDQDHNRNLTKTCTKKNEIVDSAETNVITSDTNTIEKQDISIEKPDLSNEKLDTYIVKPDALNGKLGVSNTKPEVSNEKLDPSITNPEASNEKLDISSTKHSESNKKLDMSIDDSTEENFEINEKELLNQSGQSVSILEIANETPEVNNETSILSLNNGSKTESTIATCENKVPMDLVEIKPDEKKAACDSNESNSFLGESHKIDCVHIETVNKDHFFREVNMNKPPDLTSDSLAAKAALLLNVQNSDNEFEDSDDEPSPEYEPLGDEITEDFRQHMMCIESSITDRKDEAQLVKVCNDIAIIEESKTKPADIKAKISETSPNKYFVDSTNSSLTIKKEEKVELDDKIKLDLDNSTKVNKQSKEKSWKSNKNRNGEVKGQNMLIDLPKTSDNGVSRDIKEEILDGLEIIKKSVENSLKSPTNKKRHKLSLNKDKSKTEEIVQNIDTKDLVILNDNTINPRYKTIDQIEEIMKNKPKRPPIENGEISIPEINENGYLCTRKIDTPDLKDDDDFDIDEASISSEDSEISLPQNNIPARRTLRSRPEKKGGLQDPEFLTYMELRQDDLMEEHPELSRDDIVLYLYKTFAYAQNLKASDIKLEEATIVKQEAPTPPRRKTKTPQIQPKNTLENFFREKYKNAKKIDFERSESTSNSGSSEDIKAKREMCTISPVDSGIGNSKDSNESDTSVTKRKTKSKSPTIDLTSDITKEVKVELITDDVKQESPKTPKRSRKKSISPRVLQSHLKTIPNDCLDKRVPIVVISPIKKERISETKRKSDTELKNKTTETKRDRVAEVKYENETETESMDSESELPLRQLRSKVIQENKLNVSKNEILEPKDEIVDTASVSSENEPLLKLIPKKVDKNIEGSYEDPEFLKYLELKQDDIMDNAPQLSYNEIKAYLYKTWIYEKGCKSEIQTSDDIVSSNLIKGLNQETVAPQRKVRRKPKTEKNLDVDEIIPKEKPKRKTVSHYYNEAFISDIEDELEVFEIFKTKKTSTSVASKSDSPKKEINTEVKAEQGLTTEVENTSEEINTIDEIELYFKQLTSSKPSVFKGLVREKVCEICEDISNLIKCKGCNGMFHYDCVNKVIKQAVTPTSFKGRKKKKKRKPKGLDDAENSDERNDISEENISMEELESITIDAATIESQIEAKMKELLRKEPEINYDSYSSDDGIDWLDTIPGKCEIIDIKLKRHNPQIDYSNFKCINCQKYDTPVCFVCKSAVSKTDVKVRQKCNVAHCYNYYHLGCLDHWPQTQFNAGEWKRSNKKVNEQFEALTCPRHVCHTCVSDDPRGCKTRFSGDKLARCVRCPATYHSFNKCLPAGTQILTASLIICPRHYEHRPGKVPCHVNTGWCFICALGGSLICCEYCPTSFHAECLNIKPPEGNYMCEDCETGRLPLYGEMVWVKLGHYRWWPGVILHPSEIPDNIMAVKHGLGEFVVRFFGQYDHYWVNRGRVFPYQEGDSGRISSQRSKIDAAFTTAMEHAQRAFEILKNAEPDEDESLDIASSLLPPHYVKLKSNKPIGSLLGRKIEDPSLSLTQCECSPAEEEPCGANSQCLNRVLLTECGPTCRAGERCNNRAFEKRQYPKLTPYRASHRGWGLKTLEDIKAGQFVIEYVGELIDVEEFQRRMRRKHEIRDENFYFLTLDKERMIDAGPKGNLARFMNHCCEPNCETQKWTVLGDIRVGLFAIDDIKANSEVTFNYNLECTGIEKKRCLCGAKRCSGYIGAKPKQLDETQRKKNGMLTGKRKYTKRKNIEESPSTSKIKVKKPLGRPPKPKELTEIEKDLLIIKNATVSSDESSRPQSIEEKNLKPMKRKRNSKSIEEVPILNGASKEKNSTEESNTEQRNRKKLDSDTTQEGSISNDIEPSNPLKRKLDSNTTEKVSILSTEPSAKRQKCDSQSEVGD